MGKKSQNLLSSGGTRIHNLHGNCRMDGGSKGVESIERRTSAEKSSWRSMPQLWEASGGGRWRRHQGQALRGGILLHSISLWKFSALSDCGLLFHLSLHNPNNSSHPRNVMQLLLSQQAHQPPPGSCGFRHKLLKTLPRHSRIYFHSV